MTRFTPQDGTHLIDGEIGPYVSFDELYSFAPHWARTQARLDPFYSNLWGSPSSASWIDRRTLTLYENAGTPLSRRMKRMSGDIDPHEFWTNSRSNGFIKDTLASVMMWRTMTCDQMAAVTGRREWMGHHYASMPQAADRLVAAAMLKVGTLPRVPAFKPPTLLSPGRMSSWQSFCEQLDFDEWLAITAGQTVDATIGSSMVRHTVATTELALRIAQFAPVDAVAGEHLGAHRTLVPSIRSAALAHAKYAAADAVIVMPDGRLVAIEMTVSKHNTAAKVRRWSETMAYDSSERTSVLFVTAPAPGKPRQVSSLTRRHVKDELARVRATMGVDYSNRFFVADWEQWFPAPGRITSRFASLPVQVCDNGEWTWVDLLSDDFAWTPKTDAHVANAGTSVVAMNMLRGIPHFQRDDELAADARKRLDIVNVMSRFEALPVLSEHRATSAPDRSDWMRPPSLLDDA